MIPIITILLNITLLLNMSADERRTFYVAPTGNNAHPGTEAQPLCTIQKAADLARARGRGPVGFLGPSRGAGGHREREHQAAPGAEARAAHGGFSCSSRSSSTRFISSASS